MDEKGIVEDGSGVGGSSDGGDLDILIKRFMNLKDGPDLDGSFQDDDLFKENQGNTSTCDYQWFNDEIGFGSFDTNETGAPLCIGINTDYDVANISMDRPCTMGILKLSPDDTEVPAGVRGEGIASLTGSILQHLAAYDDSISGQESQPGMNNSMEMSICKSENLFSPLADGQPDLPALSTFSTDSLDVRSDILANCTATNTHNYTIAFNGNNNILDESYTIPFNKTTQRNTTTTINNRSKNNSNNNGSSNDSSWTVDNYSHLITQSCPNGGGGKRRLFDLRRHSRRNDSDSNSSGSSIPFSSDESMPYVSPKIERIKSRTTQEEAEIIKRSIQIQTSVHQLRGQMKPSINRDSKSSPVYVCYPNYTLPDLQFLKDSQEKSSSVYLIPTGYKVPMRTKSNPTRAKRPMSCNDIEELKARDLSHIRDWPSLNFLLPESYRSILREINPKKTEENNEDEKSAEAGLGLESNSPVILRKRPNISENGVEKRYSLNGSKSNRRYAKRFSLQEPIIPEINEITNEINKNLRVLNEMDSELFGGSSCGSGGGDSENGGIVQVPQNTPRISFIDNNTDSGGALKIIQNSASRITRMQLQYMTEKQGLSDAIGDAVTQIQSLVKPRKSSSNLIIFSQSQAGKLVLDSLCPALYSLLSDGLCPFLDTIFGKIPNTVWRVIEASIQYGPTAQTLNELVMKINSEDCLSEGPMKFNAFVCGLLNLGNLSSWLLFLRTKERLLRTHYDPEGLLFLCNTSTRSLYDSMVETVNYLTKLPFQLDIFHEVKVLHKSISSSKGKIRSASASASRKSHSNVDSNKLTLEVNRTPSSKYSKYYVNQLKKTQMKRSYSDERPNPSKVQIGSSIPKSKTSQNILIDKNEKHYTSTPKLHSNHKEPSSKILRIKPTQITEKGVEPMKIHQRPKSLGSTFDNEKDSEKFRNLRAQWEFLASDEKSKGGGGGGGVTSPGFSKIPRPINSPIKSNKEFIPHPQQKLTKR